MIKVRRALFSVSDKTGLVPFARSLVSIGCEIIATGGTRRELEKGGVPSTEITQITHNPEAFGGRMKTISFEIGSALLFDRDKDRREAEKLGILPIDLVVCNLYPFRESWKNDVRGRELIEKIDIGGPTMIRAAAKNFGYVGVVTDPAQYEWIMRELSETGGRLRPETRKSLMRAAFNYTADYEAAVAMGMDEMCEISSCRLSFSAGRRLKYGENHHQHAWVYDSRDPEVPPVDLQVFDEKVLSFNNYLDLFAALEAVKDLEKPGCAVVKHTTPCGLAEAESQKLALSAAWEGDPISAFGSILAFNRTVELETVEFLQLDSPDRNKRKFVEIVVGPDFTDDALAALRKSKNLRVIRRPPGPLPCEFRVIGGKLLRQDRDDRLFSIFEGVTKAPFDSSLRKLGEFGLKAVKWVKSNAIAIVRKTLDGGFQMLGMGAGQPNRVSSTLLALEKCRENLAREADLFQVPVESHWEEVMAKAVLVSDGFFPFPDCIEEAAEDGIRFVIQPGGSIRDQNVIQKCDELGVAMVLTDMRHFRH